MYSNFFQVEKITSTRWIEILYVVGNSLLTVTFYDGKYTILKTSRHNDSRLPLFYIIVISYHDDEMNEQSSKDEFIKATIPNLFLRKEIIDFGLWKKNHLFISKIVC